MIETIGGKKHEPRKKKGLTTRTHSQMVAQDTVRVEAESPGDFDVRFVGAWEPTNHSQASGGRYMRISSSARGYVEVSFYGKSITPIVTKTNASSNRLEVYLDGEYIGTYSAYASSDTWQSPLGTFNAETVGHHSLKIEKVGSGWLLIDAFDIVGSSVVTIECQ